MDWLEMKEERSWELANQSAEGQAQRAKDEEFLRRVQETEGLPRRTFKNVPYVTAQAWGPYPAGTKCLATRTQHNVILDFGVGDIFKLPPRYYLRGIEDPIERGRGAATVAAEIAAEIDKEIIDELIEMAKGA